MKRSLLLTLLSFCVISLANAQLQTPNASPAATVSQQVGFTKIAIDYSSPGVKGRKVFGDVVKYGTPWRAGANGPTTIEFSTGVKIGDTEVRAGKYSVFITPNENGAWAIHFNKEQKSVYAYMKDNKIDMEALGKDLALTIEVTPTMASDSMERLTYMISANDNKSATITMAWDKVRLAFDVNVKVDDMMKAFGNAIK